jgi:hypothetical protein
MPGVVFELTLAREKPLPASCSWGFRPESFASSLE